jgi:hypothetical protein
MIMVNAGITVFMQEFKLSVQLAQTVAAALENGLDAYATVITTSVTAKSA